MGVLLLLAMMGIYLTTVIIDIKSSKYWFTSDLPKPSIVANWTEKEISNNLFRLSRWDGFIGNSQFRRFVLSQIRPLNMTPTQKFHFLEVGVGVGAFAREILLMYPLSTGHGIDMVKGAIAIAHIVLPAARMSLAVSDMRHIEKPSLSYDVIYVPGAICYLPDMDSVRIAIAEFTRLLKVGGGLCLSMIASDDSEMGSCKTRISKTLWSKIKNLYIVKLEEMDSWHLPHCSGRYSICMRKL
jgi:hypothetical protein